MGIRFEMLKSSICLNDMCHMENIYADILNKLCFLSLALFYHFRYIQVAF